MVSFPGTLNVCCTPVESVNVISYSSTGSEFAGHLILAEVSDFSVTVTVPTGFGSTIIQGKNDWKIRICHCSLFTLNL